MKRDEFKLARQASVVVQLYTAGNSLAATGAVFDVSESSVRRLFKRLGVPVRTISETQPLAWTAERRARHAARLRGRPSGASGKRWKLAKRCEKPAIRGENNPSWKGGITPLVWSIRTDARYAEWRLAVFRRDDFRCVQCGYKPRRHVGLNADHIRPLSFLIRRFGVKRIADARRCQELWDVDNGQTLCIDCHKRTETFGLKAMSYSEE
jgi:5-methylcytosine-specific restriction endonuclease McrA